jgi:hypothetical protein
VTDQRVTDADSVFALAARPGISDTDECSDSVSALAPQPGISP